MSCSSLRRTALQFHRRRLPSVAAAALVLAAADPSLAATDDASKEPEAVTEPGPAAKPAVAIPKVPLGFSKLLVRLEGTDEIGIAGTDFHIRLIERMRAGGFEAVGAENLVFGKDETNRAEYLVGGTVRELVCARQWHNLSCRIGIDWQLLDVARDEVVYTVTSRASVIGVADAQKERIAGMLVDGAMDALITRDLFRQTLAHRTAAEAQLGSSFVPATLPKCALGSHVASNADDLLQQIVVVKSKDGFGSGFFVSGDGLVVTAAHVIRGPVKLRLRNGVEVDAVPVRIAPREDVALLRPTLPITGQSCMAIRADTPSSGTEIYAAGAPASLELAFSLTRGIVSGYPVLDGRRRLQVDAPVNPGNSGGPIVDANGAALGVVSFKIVAAKVEGVAFAIPMPEALAALALRIGTATDPTLLSEVSADPRGSKLVAVADEATPVPSLDPEGDRRRRKEKKAADAAAQARAEEERRTEEEAADLALREADRDRRTRWYVPTMRWGGVALAAVGTVTAIATYVRAEDAGTTQARFDKDRTWNTVAWGVAGVGAATFGLSWAFRPTLAAKGTVTQESGLVVGPAGISWSGSF